MHAHLDIGARVAPQCRGRLRTDIATVRNTDQGEVAFGVATRVQVVVHRRRRIGKGDSDASSTAK